MVRRTKLLVPWYHLPLKMDHLGVVLVASDLDGLLDQYSPSVNDTSLVSMVKDTDAL